ncbi:Sec-independent protein translocase subunit TatC [Salinisphaera shabanensis T35B1]|jgi:sec-independent protein translocase protein TatC|uniref:Sec-independent protein translocase protein TatC n=1 Tax=Salinisphaera shabanensis E1L3A TaxID=1033802 RepID=U2EH19_9GAMM|nr:twin-arginine translocase subunit TatC [Salinisphaera shabanensis]ERJ17692.1 TatABCE protein translocation system subunit [Salinisphaera shabanensis E1L3A]
MSDEELEGQEQPLIAHLLELRTRLLRIVIGILVVFLPMAYFARDLFTFLSGPLLAHMPEGNSLIATGVAAPFLAPFKLSMLLAVAVSLPWTLYQVWMFVAPGLYAQERRLVTPLLISSTGLFYLGMAFAYYVVFPVVFGFFISVAPVGVAVMTDISAYLDFVLGMFLAFGIAFELPVGIFLIVWAGFVTPRQLASYRAYIIVAAFAVGMVLTPPDVISQTLLAVPVYLLYEVGIVMARLFVPGMREVEAQQDEQSGGP